MKGEKTMHEEFENGTGNRCIFTDDGIWYIPRPDAKSRLNMSDRFFPYGSITKIKFGTILGGLEVIGTQSGTERSFYYVSRNVQRQRIKELILLTKEKMKVAPQADVIEGEFGYPHIEAEQFYVACKDAKLTLTKDASNATIERAKLIIKQNQLNISDDKILEVYFLGESETNRRTANNYYKSLFSQAKNLEKYAAYHGRDKAIAMLQDEANYYSTLWDTIVAGKSLPRQQENDWALMGGIATGLAGTAAGISVASALQAENAAIRARNDQIYEQYIKALMPNLSELMIKAGTLRAMAKDKSTALVDDSSPEMLFQSITFSNTKAHILDDCSVVVTVEATLPFVEIFETVNANIDGTLTAVISQNGKAIGEALMVIPQQVHGVVPYLLAGACSSKADKNASCEIEFKPRDLWAIEW